MNIKLDSVADWQALLSHRMWEAEQACSESNNLDKDGEWNKDFCDLYQDTEIQLTQLCYRAHKLTKRARKFKDQNDKT